LKIVVLTGGLKLQPLLHNSAKMCIEMECSESYGYLPSEADMTRANHLTSQDLQHLRAALVSRQRELLASRRTNAAPARQVTDETEAVDFAEQIVEQDDALRIDSFDQSLLSDIEHALAKLDAGTYGVSEQSRMPIPLARLQVLPWARLTLEEEEERLARNR
jgi:DnaK suppressor protein